MAIDFSAASGQLGALIKAFNSCDAAVGNGDLTDAALLSVGIMTTTIQEEFDDALQEIVDDLYSARDDARSAFDAFKSSIVTMFEEAFITIVDNDAALVDRTKEAAMDVWQVQLKGSGTIAAPDRSVDANACTVTGSANSGNTGNGKLVVTAKRPDGRTLTTIYNETIRIRCTQDGQEGGTDRGETFEVLGEPAAESLQAWNWPLGSGASESLTVVDAASTGNLATNGDFESWTGSALDEWSVIVGVYGTDIVKEATTIYGTHGLFSLEFLGDGATLSSIAHTFADGDLAPNTRYSVNFYARKSASLSAGSLQIRLLDGSNAVVSDDFGTANSYTIAHGTLTTSFAGYNVTFITPKVLPAVQKIGIRLSVAGTSSESIFVDDFAFVEMTELYEGGPAAALFAGSTNFILNDEFTIAATNDFGGVFETAFWQFFDMPSMGIQMFSNSAGSETILDSVATVS